MKPPTPLPSSARAGFSLPEMLVAIVIGATLVTTAVTFALSMGELWGNGSEARLFDQHVRGVSRFLEQVLARAEPPPAEATSGVQAGQPRTEEQAIVWQAPRGPTPGATRLLTFQLAQSPGIFAWPGEPLPFVVCALRVDPREGLFLQWQSRLEVDFGDAPPRELRVSPFVTRIDYFYFDEAGANSSWEQSDRPRFDANRVELVPQRVRLTFEYEGETRLVNLILPGASASVPVF